MSKVLLIGPTGNLGPHLANALVQDGHKVTAVLRPDSFKKREKTNPLSLLGIKIIQGDMDDPSSIRGACFGQDIILSAVGGNHLGQQVSLARIAKEAGVKRFVPSEFGVDPISTGPGICDLFDLKASVQRQLKEIDIPTTMIYNNGFMEFWATGLGQLGPTSPPDTVQVYGDGSTRAYMTSLPDIARYTSKIVADPRTENREIKIENVSTSQNEMIEIWEDLSSQSVERVSVSANDLERIIASSNTPETFMQKVFTQLHKSVWINEDCMKTRPAVLDVKDLYPEIKPKDIHQYLGQFIG